MDSGDRPTQLRDLAAALRKAEEVDDKLRALRNLERALLAAPDELKHYAGELTLFLNPSTYILIRKRHPYIGHLMSETLGGL